MSKVKKYVNNDINSVLFTVLHLLTCDNKNGSYISKSRISVQPGEKHQTTPSLTDIVKGSSVSRSPTQGKPEKLSWIRRIQGDMTAGSDMKFWHNNKRTPDKKYGNLKKIYTLAQPWFSNCDNVSH